MNTFKYITYISLLIVCMIIPALADVVTLRNGTETVNVCRLTAPAAESSTVLHGTGVFYGIIVKTDGTNDVTLNVYDNISATGTKLVPSDVVVSGSQKVWALSYSPAIKCDNGIYVSVSVAGGGSVSYQVLYDK